MPHFSKNVEHCFCHQNLFVTYPKTIYHANFEVHLRSSRGSASILNLANSPEHPSYDHYGQNFKIVLKSLLYAHSKALGEAKILKMYQNCWFLILLKLFMKVRTAMAILFFVCISQNTYCKYSIITMKKLFFLSKAFK